MTGLLVVAILVSAGVGYLIGTLSARTLTSVSTTTLLVFTTTSTETATVTVAASRTPVYSPSSPTALMVNPYHLLLQLSLANSTVTEGVNVTLHIRMTNLLAVTNYVPIGRSWAIPGYWPGNPCSSTGDYQPLGIVIFKGSFSALNVSLGKFLSLYESKSYNCPGGTDSLPWVFPPMSDAAWNSQDSLASQVLWHLDANLSTNGYWSSENRFANFSPGTYTVAAGDEWGDLVFLYFTVS